MTMPSDNNYNQRSYETESIEYTEFVISCMSKYHPFVDDDKRVHLKSQNDGTYIFLQEMLAILVYLKCTGIKHKSYIASNEQIPADKPWLKNVDEVSGILPPDLASMI